jgi:beta-galactosidase
MGFFGEFDHHAMGRDLDLASWDSYPLGHTDSTSFIDLDERLRWARSGHPDIAAFHHDLYRGIGRGRFGVMEQQAGPVNWAPWNPVPQAGQVRAWTWEAFAHRAEFVCYFRWRQLPYAQEQMHSGLHDSDDHVTPGGEEAACVASELPAVCAALTEEAPTPAPVALVLDYTSHWMIEIQRQGADASYFGDAFALYGAARRLGLDVDIVGPDAPLDDRALVLVPTLLAADDTFARRLAASSGQVVIGARSGSKTGDFHIADGLPPGPLAQHAGLRVRSVESLRPGLSLGVRGAALQGHARAWREHVEPAPDTEVLARFEDGGAAVLRRGRMRYLAATFDNDLLDAIVGAAARDAGLSTAPLPVGLRLRRRGRVQFAFHSGPGRARVPAPAGATWLLGGPDLDPAGVAAWVVD